VAVDDDTVLATRTQNGGQTLPSPHYLRDDVQYFASPAEVVPRQTNIANRVSSAAPIVVDAKRQSLRYGDATFDECQLALVTQLKAEERLEAMRAVGVFGANGYAQEAASTIIEVLNGYPLEILLQAEVAAVFDEHDRRLLEVGQLALMRIGAAASPVLVDAVKDRTHQGYGRYLALAALASQPSSKQVATRAILDLLEEPRDVLCQPGLECIGIFPELSDLVVERLSPVIGDCTLPIEFRRNAVGVVGKYGPRARGAVPALVRFMQEDDRAAGRDSSSHRSSIIEAIGRIGPVSREAITILMQTLEEEKAKWLSQNENQHSQSYAEPAPQAYILNGFASNLPNPPLPSPPSKSVAAIEKVLKNLPIESIPALTEIVVDNDEDGSLRQLAVAALQAIESKAKPPLPSLRKFLELRKPEALLKAATNPIDTIGR